MKRIEWNQVDEATRAQLLTRPTRSLAAGVKARVEEVMAEVAARVRAILRREARSRGTEAMEPATTWRHDAAGMRIVFRAQTLDLTRYEYLLLALLLSSPGRVFTREQIMDRVWSEAPETSDRSIDTHVKTLRAKLRAVDPIGEPIVTHRGIGYSLAP